MNGFEKIIGFLAPGIAIRRAMGRSALRQIESYEAAAKGRRTNHWRRTRNDADADIIPSLSWLRNTSRMIVRNNPYAFQAIESLVCNTVGDGIRPDFTGPAGMVKIVKQYWKKHMESTQCDWTGQMNFYGQTSLGTRGMFESGGVLLIRRRIKAGIGALPVKFQLLESDYIDLNKTDMGVPVNGRGYIRHGLEYNNANQLVAYWLFKTHPGNQFGFYAQSERVPAEDVIYMYRTLRPGQDHGVPAGVSSFLRLNDFDDYEDAELMSKKISACYAVFISGGVTDLPGGTDEKEPREKLAPGIIERLRPGETVSVATPQVSQGVSEFHRVKMLGVSVGYGTTYEKMTNDLVNVNLSSIRVGDIEHQRRITEVQRNTIIPKYCERVMRWFLEALSLVETIDIDKIDVSWTPPRRQMIDVDKETKALGNQILFGLNSWSEIARENGNNANELADEIAADQKMFKDKGIVLTSDASNTAAKPAPSPIDDTATNDNEPEQDTVEDVGSGGKQAKGKNPAKKTAVNKS